MKDKKEEIVLARVEDACENLWEPRFFDFCDEAMQQKMTRILNRAGCPYAFWGGFPSAGRKMLCVYPDYVDGEALEWPMMAARFPREGDYGHRNVLGELMALGITRECLGDISLDDDEVQVVFSARIAPFIRQEFVKVKGRPIRAAFGGPETIRDYPLHFETLDVVAASPRVDGVLGKIWGMSRQNVVEAVKQGRVQINYEEVAHRDARLEEGDIISFRGKGKARIDHFGGITKKGNLRITVKKYV